MIIELFLILIVTVQDQALAGVAPGDEDARCSTLREVGSAPIPAYSSNMKVLMDSWNYVNLLSASTVRTGAVWQQIDNDMNNPPMTTTNVNQHNY